MRCLWAIRLIILPLLMFLVIFVLSRSVKSKPTIQKSEKLIKKGKAKYRVYCGGCHNRKDPRKKGPIGPDVWGSSLALIEARVLRKSYPKGYKPKRKTKIMPRLPHVKKYIPSIHSYLNSEIK